MAKFVDSKEKDEYVATFLFKYAMYLTFSFILNDNC